jgi:poly(ADP-ribose) glycohydrolase ARH3
MPAFHSPDDGRLIYDFSTLSIFWTECRGIRYIQREGQMTDNELVRKKYLGSLLGAALGDAIGASWEGHQIAGRREIELIAKIPCCLRYTDDTHMTIGIAESLVECRGFDGKHMTERFIENYFKEPWRGYGPGPPRVFGLIKNGMAWGEAAGHIYPGGSFGNGAAMRVAPVGLFFWNQSARLREVAYLQSRITHSHVLGMEGAALQAMAVALAVAANPDTPLGSQSFLSNLMNFATEDVYRAKIAKSSSIMDRSDDRQEVVRELGHGIEAFNSVPTSIFAFLTHSQDFSSTIIYAVSLGGDTDTIASMAGAISGAYLGVDAIPPQWRAQLENRDYILDLANRLWQIASSY